MLAQSSIITLFAILAIAMAFQQGFGYVQAKEIRNKYLDFYRRECDSCIVAYGRAKSTLRLRGCIVIVAVDNAGTVREAMVMEGRSVFAKLHDDPSCRGLELSSIPQRPATRKERSAEPLKTRALRNAAENVRSYVEQHASAACGQ